MVAIVTSAFPIDEICPVTIVTVQSLPPRRLFIAKSKDVLGVVAAVILISLVVVAQQTSDFCGFCLRGNKIVTCHARPEKGE